MSANTTHAKMRVWHRYLGFFLAGIMAVYAISGIVMIFRDTNFLKRETLVQKNLSPHLSPDSLAKALRLRDLKITAQQDDRVLFKQGSYNVNTGIAS